MKNEIYVIKIGKLASDVEELTVFVKNENVKSDFKFSFAKLSIWTISLSQVFTIYIVVRQIGTERFYCRGIEEYNRLKCTTKPMRGQMGHGDSLLMAGSGIE